MTAKGTSLSEDTDVVIISPNRWTLFFPETDNLIFGVWKLIRNWECPKVWKLIGLKGKKVWLANWAALKITKFQIFSFSEENVCLFGVMTKTSVLSDKNVPLQSEENHKWQPFSLKMVKVVILCENSFHFVSCSD